MKFVGEIKHGARSGQKVTTKMLPSVQPRCAFNALTEVQLLQTVGDGSVLAAMWLSFSN